MYLRIDFDSRTFGPELPCGGGQNTPVQLVDFGQAGGLQNQVASQTTGRKRRRHAPCRRNGVALQTVDQPRQWIFVPDQVQSTNKRAHVIIAQLSVPSLNSTTHNPLAWVSSVQNTISMTGLDKDDPRHLPTIIRRCAALRTKEVGCGFVTMLSMIQLAFKCQRCVSQCFPASSSDVSISLLSTMGEGVTLEHVYSTYIVPLIDHPEVRTFTEWVSFGKKFTRLAGGGSIYILLLISGLDLRWELAQAPQATVFSVGDMLRRPTKAKEGQYIPFSQPTILFMLMHILAYQTLFPGIIDTIAKMRQVLPLQFEVEGFQPLDCTDLQASDRFFDQLKMKQVLLPRMSDRTALIRL